MSDRTPCTVEGCESLAWPGGLCAKHRARLYRHGTTDLLRPPGRPAAPAIDRFLAKVTFGENRHDGTPCLLWTGVLTSSGYGRFAARTEQSKPIQVQAHRWLYERWVGPIPEGMVADHLCHDPMLCHGGNDCQHRRCVNPLHLRIVTPAENAGRTYNALKSHCLRGHELTGENVRITAAGTRRCVVCAQEKQRERWLAQKADRS